MEYPLHKELETYHAQSGQEAHIDAIGLLNEFEYLQAENKRLRSALEFYACKGLTEGQSELRWFNDCGETARVVLSEGRE